MLPAQVGILLSKELMRYPSFLLAILAVGCSQQITVHTDYDPDYDLWAYKTFDWGQKVNIEEGRNPLHYNELNDKRIKSAVQKQLSKRGYELAAESPDLILHYHIIVKDQSVLTTEPFGYSYGQYWTNTNTSIYSYKEGTLILDLMDSKTNHLIWRGWAVTDVKESYSPEGVKALTEEVVSKIFRKFPKRKM
jgi:hypothetical protein